MLNKIILPLSSIWDYCAFTLNAPTVLAVFFLSSFISFLYIPSCLHFKLWKNTALPSYSSSMSNHQQQYDSTVFFCHL